MCVYSGDVSLEYGGTFFNINDSDWGYGYCSAVRVTDLDSGCGYRGAVLVEKVVIMGMDDRKRKRQAIESSWGIKDFANQVRRNRESYRPMLADALLSYGFYDPEEDYVTPSSTVIQCEEEGPMVYDGWKADYRLPEGEDLKTHIEREFVDFA